MTAHGPSLSRAGRTDLLKYVERLRSVICEAADMDLWASTGEIALIQAWLVRAKQALNSLE